MGLGYWLDVVEGLFWLACELVFTLVVIVIGLVIMAGLLFG